MAALDDNQQAVLLVAIETYTGDSSDTEAEVYMAEYTAELPDTVLGHSGSTDITEEDNDGGNLE